MSTKCTNCGSNIGGMFGAALISGARIASFKEYIECPDELCTKCDGPFESRYDHERQVRARKTLAAQIGERVSPLQKAIERMPVVSIDVLPPGARYKLIGLVNFQSTLGTGAFAEIGSSLSNVLGTEARMLNDKMSTSVEKCKQAIKALAFQAGGNAVIGVDFQFSTNSRDATTVAVQGTAVFVENPEEVFKA